MMVLMLSTVETNSSLGQRVQLALHSLSGNQMRDVCCSANGRTVLLEGHTSSFYNKQLAQTIAKKIHGVYRVINQIEVVRP